MRLALNPARTLVLGLALGFGSRCIALASPDGAHVTPFPDDWFFSGAARPPQLRALEGKPAPALQIDTWIGDEVSLGDNRGKVIVVDFWATWCGPCMASIPHNVELVKEYADQGLVFVGVHDSNTGWERAPQVVKDKGINYPIGRDKGGESVKAYALQFWPTYVAIDRSGVIRAAGLTPGHVEDVIKVLLAEQAPDGDEGDAADEFEPAFFYGGSGRPQSLRAMQGKRAPALEGEGWIGLEPAPGVMKDSVVVVTFVSPAISVSMTELDRIAALEQELGPQGVVFVAVSDGRAAWEPIQEHATASNLHVPIMRDSAETRKGEGGVQTPVSVTADAFGIDLYPTTVVIDRTGTIRAAGVRADKVKEIVEKLLGEASGAAPSGGTPSPGKEDSGKGNP